MQQVSVSTPWYHSLKAVIPAAILVPPVGLVLLWLRRETEIGKKVFGSLAIAAIMGVYVYLIVGGGDFRETVDPGTEAHYAELERQRAGQREGLAAAPNAASSTEPTASPSTPAANANDSRSGNAGGSTSTRPARTYWTNFRGPARDGRYEEAAVRTDWPADGLPLLWKQPIGGGYSSFVVAEGVAFTIEQRRRQEMVAAYDVATGRELWTHGWDAEFKDSTGDGPRSTPTWDSSRIYALGAQGELRCLDAKNGKLLWSKNILSDNSAQNLPWGMAASPLIVDDKVIVLPGGSSGRSVVAYNKLTGATIWRSLNDRQAYVSPMLVTLAGRRHILVVTSSRVVGLAPDSGAVLWESSWNTDMGINVSQPIVIDANHVFISSGYGKGAALVEVSSANDGMAARKVWEKATKGMNNKFNSSVLHEGYAYGLDEGILACVDVQTGEQKWKGGRYGYGQVILASGHLIVITDGGELVLVKATPDKHTEVARFSALEGKTWNYPAIASGRLLVRNQTQMACYDIAAR